MGQRYSEISNNFREFIHIQKLFFVSTATSDGKINLSPKGMDSFRILDKNRICWLNLTGSGNETATHLLENPRMTIMFTAFSGKPIILRLYGTAKVIHKRDSEWEELVHLFPKFTGARQIIDMNVEMVQKSCGMGVPLYDYVGERDLLDTWADNVGEQGIVEYWENKNQISLDGKNTEIMERNRI